MMRDDDVIAALTTPPGRSGIAVLRVSGREAAHVVDRVFRFGPVPKSLRVPTDRDGTSPSPARTVQAMDGYTAAFGYLVHPETGKVIDEAVITRFRAPRSYTGEDVVELSIHGSALLARSALRALMAAGARAAGPGEFTERAFLNGKMDLAQAEAVIDLIDSEATAGAEAALRHLSGALGDEIRAIRTDGIRLLSEIELAIQYPEHEDSNITREAIQARLEGLRGKIRGLLASRDQGRIVKDGLSVVLVGRPNAGKSSLLNALSGEDRALVTDIPGTTRDLVDVRLEVAGLPVVVRDTAGLRETEDTLEQLSIERTARAIRDADLILVMVDPGDFPTADDVTSWLKAIGDRPYVLVETKHDRGEAGRFSASFRTLADARDEADAGRRLAEGPSCFAVTRISTLDPRDIAPVWTLIEAYYTQLAGGATHRILITSARHAAELEAADHALSLGMQGDGLIPEDMVATALMNALEHLGAITGEEVTESMLDDLFSRFCVGK